MNISDSSISITQRVVVVFFVDKNVPSNDGFSTVQLKLKYEQVKPKGASLLNRHLNQITN